MGNEKVRSPSNTDIKAKVLLGLYAGFSFFFLCLYTGLDWYIRKSAGMPVGPEFSPAEAVLWGIPLGVLGGFLIYKITGHFEHRLNHSSDLEKSAAYCLGLNLLTFCVISALFLLLKIGVHAINWTSIFILFLMGFVIGSSSYLNIRIKKMRGEHIESLKLEHEELKTLFNLFVWATVIFFTGAVVVSMNAFWGRYYPEIPEPIVQQMTLFMSLVILFIVGVLGILLQILGGMAKIRLKIGQLSVKKRKKS